MLQKLKTLLWLSIGLVSIFLSGCGGAKETDASYPLEAQVLGAASSSILSASPYSSIRLEIAYAPGMAPDANVVSYLTSFISNHAFKPGGITVEQHAVSSQKGMGPLNADLLVQLESGLRTTHTQDSTVSVFILFTDGTSHKDTSSLKEYGVAYNATSYAVFKNSILTSIDAQSQSRVEKTVLTHEFGHLMGLVNSVRNGVDLSVSKHCNNPTCLMYSDVYNGPTTNQIPPNLDNDCLSELKALGGK